MDAYCLHQLTIEDLRSRLHQQPTLMDKQIYHLECLRRAQEYQHIADFAGLGMITCISFLILVKLVV